MQIRVRVAGPLFCFSSVTRDLHALSVFTGIRSESLSGLANLTECSLRTRRAHGRSLQLNPSARWRNGFGLRQVNLRGLPISSATWPARLGPERYAGPLSHYHYRILAKEGGAIRLIEAPKERLKRIQKQILAEIIEKIPVHPAVHGFRRGRSVRTFAAPHVGQQVVLRMDLRDFFPSISTPRVQAMFRTAGYPESVANLLGGLCTTAAPRALWQEKGWSLDPLRMADARHLYAWPHLPQGAPSSPSLANICAFRVDCRLTGLAEGCGAVYTRYADDLAFSGGENFEHGVERFAIHAAAILLEEGFAVHHRKTRIMRQGVRQYLAGVVTNRRLNVPRPDYDRLKAILTNCIRQGPASQNHEAHADFRASLAGRVSFVEMINPDRGARLRRLFDQITW